MENKDMMISELPTIDNLTGEELLPAVKNKLNGSISVSLLKEYINDNLNSYESNGNKLIPGYGINISPENEISVTVDLTIFRFVSALPVKGIESKIYLVKDPSDNNLYLEFVYADEQWILLGRHRLYANTDNMVSRQEYNKLLERIEQLEAKLG